MAAIQGRYYNASGGAIAVPECKYIDIQIINDAVFTVITGDSSVNTDIPALQGVTLREGMVIRGPFHSFTLDSGVIYAASRVNSA